MQNLITLLSHKTTLSPAHIKNILNLLDDGATIPFIARYRKELTGNANDETLREFEMAYESAKKLLIRKEEVLRLIEERATLTPELIREIENAQTLNA